MPSHSILTPSQRSNASSSLFMGTRGLASDVNTTLGQRNELLSQGVAQSSNLENNASDFKNLSKQNLEALQKKSNRLWPFGGKLKSRRHKRSHSRKHKRNTRRHKRHTRKH